MDEDDDHKRRREELDAILYEVRQFATAAELRRILKKLGTPEDVERALTELKDMRNRRDGRRIVLRDIYYVVVTTAALVAALIVIRKFGGDILEWMSLYP